jgi:hypothetical protein
LTPWKRKAGLWDLELIKKTKYMKMSSSENRRWTSTVTLGKYTFERVKSFSHLGTILNSKNMAREEINRRITAGNRAYFASVKLLNIDLTVQALKGQALQDLH